MFFVGVFLIKTFKIFKKQGLFKKYIYNTIMTHKNLITIL